MGTIASHITSLTIVYSTVYAGADQRNIKAPRHRPLCREFTGDRWIPAQMASNAENVSIWWRHHDSCMTDVSYVGSSQVYLHEQDDVPQIKNLGFAVSPGVHALVAARYNTVSGDFNSLSPSWEILVLSNISHFQTRNKNRYLELLLWICPNMNFTWPHL